MLGALTSVSKSWRLNNTIATVLTYLIPAIFAVIASQVLVAGGPSFSPVSDSPVAIGGYERVNRPSYQFEEIKSENSNSESAGMFQPSCVVDWSSY